MEYTNNEIAFNLIYYFDNAMEGGIGEFISNIIKKVKEWWINKALPFIKKIAKKVADFFIWIARGAIKIPKGIWKYIVQLGGKFKVFFEKRASDAIIVDENESFDIPNDAIAGVESTGLEAFDDILFNNHGISLESQIKNNKNIISEEIFGKDISSVNNDIDNINKKSEFDDRDCVSDKDLKEDSNRISKSIAGTIEKFAKSNITAYKNLENSIKNDDGNKASKKANYWMSKVSSFFKGISDFLRSFFQIVKESISIKKKES